MALSLLSHNPCARSAHRTAHRRDEPLKSGQLTQTITHTVACTVSGMIAGGNGSAAPSSHIPALVLLLTSNLTPGTVLGPLRAAAALTGLLVRPVLLGLAVHRGVVWTQRRMTGAGGLVRKLQSGKGGTFLVKPSEVKPQPRVASRPTVPRGSRAGNFLHRLEALRGIAARALSNKKFIREFCRFGLMDLESGPEAEDTRGGKDSIPPRHSLPCFRFSGMELLLKALAEALAEAAASSGAYFPPGILPVGVPSTVAVDDA